MVHSILFAPRSQLFISRIAFSVNVVATAAILVSMFTTPFLFLHYIGTDRNDAAALTYGIGGAVAAIVCALIRNPSISTYYHELLKLQNKRHGASSDGPKRIYEISFTEFGYAIPHNHMQRVITDESEIQDIQRYEFEIGRNYAYAVSTMARILGANIAAISCLLGGTIFYLTSDDSLFGVDAILLVCSIILTPHAMARWYLYVRYTISNQLCVTNKQQ